MKNYYHRLSFALNASAWHFTVSIVIAIAAGLFIFGVWFPYPYRNLAGGFTLFWVMMGVDIVCGPLLTLVLFNPKKSTRELGLDLSLVVVVQLAALLYGVHSIGMARPVVVAYEVDRFVVVSRGEVIDEELINTSPEYRSFSWFSGPRWIGTRNSKNGAETLESIEFSSRGIEPSSRPTWWQSYDSSRARIQQRMQPLANLISRQPKMHAVIESAAKETGLPIDAIYYLPLVSQKSLDQWSVLLDSQANIVGYAPVDGF